MQFKIVDMTPEYYEGKADVRYTAWQETYRGLMPDQYLDLQSRKKCLESIEKNPMDTIVAVCGNKVIGFACYCSDARPFTEHKETSEIMALYVLGDYQGYGVGKDLVEECLSRLPWPDVVLYVLKGNERAMGFYRHMGFVAAGKEISQEIPQGTLVEEEMVLHREGISGQGNLKPPQGIRYWSGKNEINITNSKL